MGVHVRHNVKDEVSAGIVDLIQRCVSTVKYSVKVISHIIGNITPHRGMRKGSLPICVMRTWFVCYTTGLRIT